MRAISIWQPWSSLIAFGAKRYETRAYPTAVRGKLAIHAAKRKDPDCLKLCRREPFRTALIEGGLEFIGDLPFGAIVAVVEIVGCHKTGDIRDSLSEKELAFGDFRDGRFAWELELSFKLDFPVPAVGKQGFWVWNEEEAE